MHRYSVRGTVSSQLPVCSLTCDIFDAFPMHSNGPAPPDKTVKWSLLQETRTLTHCECDGVLKMSCKCFRGNVQCERNNPLFSLEMLSSFGRWGSSFKMYHKPLKCTRSQWAGWGSGSGWNLQSLRLQGLNTLQDFTRASRFYPVSLLYFRYSNITCIRPIQWLKKLHSPPKLYIEANFTRVFWHSWTMFFFFQHNNYIIIVIDKHSKSVIWRAAQQPAATPSSPW